jgi:uncharacterized protein (DUF1501 family)
METAMFSRRAFLTRSTLLALAPTVPGFLARTARAARPERDGRVLVVIQLDGGNDGVATVVPFKDEGYAKHRKHLRLGADRLHKVGDGVGLHPALGGAAKLLQAGRLAVVQGVSYARPSRSHFESMRVWHTARRDAEQRGGYGWVGSALDAGRPPADRSPAAVFLGDGALPSALRSLRAAAATLARPEAALLDPIVARAARSATEEGDDLSAFVRRSTLDAYATAERMADLVRGADAAATYPDTPLAGQLRAVARLLKGGSGTRVFYTAQPGYDTHYAQLYQHQALLSELDGALKAFLDDLAGAKLAQRVVVLCFSEFGRRVAENGSQGTDHGTAGPVLLGGDKVKGGLVGATPSLLDLEDGDLKVGLDFRRIYASVLEDWLGLPSKAALGQAFERLPLFRA